MSTRGHHGLLLPQGEDPYWAAVVSLLHFDGADGSTAFPDVTGRSWYRSGADISTTQSKFGGASGRFDDPGDRIWTAAHADLTFGSGDFTVELWFFATTAAGSAYVYRPLISRDDVSLGTNRGWLIILDGDNAGKVVFAGSVGMARSTVMSTSAPTLNVWNHVAAVRDGGNLRLYLNGVQEGSAAISGALNSPSIETRIGVGQNGAGILGPGFLGYIDDARITKGVCRYPGGTTFTPPTAPFPNS